MIQELIKKVRIDSYFIELFNKAEEFNISKFFSLDNDIAFTEKEYVDLLRFSDLLSHSDDVYDRNLSYKILSLLYDYYDFKDIFDYYSIPILSKLWNFPTINFLYSKWYNHNLVIPFDRKIEKDLKEELQKTPLWWTFTDSQYIIYNKLLNNNHFSFSGPTSLWKSFLIRSYIFDLIKHKKGNIVFLVPSKALINEIVNKLKKDIICNSIKNYKILSFPTIPTLFSDENNYIFVFTPERLISYLSNNENPLISYLFIDEAHKIISNNDSRSPLYYHAISYSQKKQINIFFSSPNIPNPDLFLKIFDLNQDENFRTQDIVVSQNRYLIDLINKEIIYFSDLSWNFNNINSDIIKLDTLSIIKELWKNEKNIIYCNSKKDTIEKALEFSKLFPEIHDNVIDNLIKLIKEDIHKEYFLIDCLKKWIWFHFGSIPQRIREKIEELFSEWSLNYIFVTSTLLEWVNLPAKNIFILNNKLWRSKMQKVDFWNLAWRAWRLTKELSWNIICIRDKKDNWEDITIIKDKNIKNVESIILKPNKNFYKNIENSLSNMNFTRKNITESEKRIYDSYWNILLFQEKRCINTILKEKFSGDIKDINKLSSISKKINLPAQLLLISSDIKAVYQDKIFNGEWEVAIMPEEVNFDTCRNLLYTIYNLYNLKDEEKLWNNSLFPKTRNHDDLIKYYATIMNDWINSASLNKIINKSILFHEKNWYLFINHNKESFDKNNRNHINEIINSVINDIDNKLKYTLWKYFNNYYFILKERYWEENAWKNWKDFLEYWTTDNRIIELQILWLERHLAIHLIENKLKYLLFNESWKLVKFDIEEIKNTFDKDSFEYEEFIKFYDSFIL